MSSEFESFNRSEGFDPPPILTERILSQVHRDLNPPAWRVFSRLSLVHFLTAMVTLSICPQFGWRLWGSGPGLMGVFMSMGYLICEMACGFFFMGSSLLVASFVLRAEEIRAIRRNRWLGLAALSLLSLGFFLMMDASIVFGFALLWILGSVIGGFLSLELGWLLRFRRLAQ